MGKGEKVTEVTTLPLDIFFFRKIGGNWLKNLLLQPKYLFLKNTLVRYNWPTKSCTDTYCIQLDEFGVECMYL